MSFDPSSVITMEKLYEEAKFWTAFGGAMWTLFTAAKWVKDIKNVDLANLQTAAMEMRTETKQQATALAEVVKENSNAVVGSVKDQTAAVVRELGELRQDFRTFYINPTQQMVPAYSRTKKARAAKLATKAASKGKVARARK